MPAQAVLAAPGRRLVYQFWMYLEPAGLRHRQKRETGDAVLHLQTLFQNAEPSRVHADDDQIAFVERQVERHAPGFGEGLVETRQRRPERRRTGVGLDQPADGDIRQEALADGRAADDVDRLPVGGRRVVLQFVDLGDHVAVVVAFVRQEVLARPLVQGGGSVGIAHRHVERDQRRQHGQKRRDERQCPPANFQGIPPDRRSETGVAEHRKAARCAPDADADAAQNDHPEQVLRDPRQRPAPILLRSGIWIGGHGHRAAPSLAASSFSARRSTFPEPVRGIDGTRTTFLGRWFCGTSGRRARMTTPFFMPAASAPSDRTR